MAYYLQRECLNKGMGLTIEPGGNILFETECAQSDRGDGADFGYDPQKGLIEINRAGSYLILWTIRQQTGIPGDGRTFCLVRQELDGLTESGELKTTWWPLAEASTQLKITNSVGIGHIVKTNAQDILRIGLQNISRDPVIISPSSPVLGQILIYGLGDFTGDMNVFYERLNYLNTQEPAFGSEGVYNDLLTTLAVIESHQADQNLLINHLRLQLTATYEDIQELTSPSNVYSHPCEGIGGMITCCLRTENIYNFWAEDDPGYSYLLPQKPLTISYGEGVMNYNPDVPGGWEPAYEEDGITPRVEDRIYLWRANEMSDPQIDPVALALSWYKGEPTITPAWMWKDGKMSMIPLQSGHPGLYFLAEDIPADFGQEDYYRFTFGLLLSTSS